MWAPSSNLPLTRSQRTRSVSLNNISVPARPWEGIPNPFGFPTIGEQLLDIHTATSKLRPSQQVAINDGSLHILRSPRSQRTAPRGTDKLGVSFEGGDLLLVGGEVYVADEIVLDDSEGYPYEAHYNSPLRQEFMLEHNSSRIFSQTFSGGRFLLQEIDLDWVPPFLGLIIYTEIPRELPVNFSILRPQSFRVRCKRLDGIGGKKSFRQDQVSALSTGLSPDLCRLLLANRKPQHVGPPFDASAHSVV